MPEPMLSPWEELEEQAYHAFREWPLFLKLRLRELRRHLPAPEVPEVTPPPPDNAHDLALLREYGLLSGEERGE